MASEKKLVSVLQELGLSNYEIRLLITLYKFGSSKADNLAKLTKIPLTRVYDSMESLEDKGFAYSTEGRPRIFHPQFPSISAEHLLKREYVHFEQRISNLKALLQQFLDLGQPLFLESNSSISPEDFLSQFSSLEEAERNTIEMIENAQNEICIFTNVFHWYKAVRNSILDALQRGVSVRILLQHDDNDLVHSDKTVHPNLNVKVIDGVVNKFRGTIVDRKKVLFLIWATEEEDIEHKRKVYRPQYSSNIGIVSVFQNNFEYLWQNQS